MPKASENETRKREAQQSWDAVMDDPAMQRELETARDELEWFNTRLVGGL